MYHPQELLARYKVSVLYKHKDRLWIVPAAHPINMSPWQMHQVRYAADTECHSTNDTKRYPNVISE